MLPYKSLFFKHLGQTSPNPMLLEIDHAAGTWLFDPGGKKYLDLISGVSVSNVGHCNPDVVRAVSEQAAKYMHLMVYGELVQEPQVKYAEKITSVLPAKLNSVYFVNSGSEAVEGAIKLARRFTGRDGIISFKNAYHGSTLGALSIQGSEEYKSAFRPLLPSTTTIRFNCTDDLEYINERTAAVVIEPVQGEAGIRVPEGNFLELLRKRCDKTGALLVFDEIQTGFGRIGAMFALEKYNVTPDILLLAKALGGGMPLGAFISSTDIMSAMSYSPVLGHITTFGGHPVSCAAGLASLNIICENNLHLKAGSKGKRFKDNIKHRFVKEVRGEGLFLAVELKDKNLVSGFIRRGIENGLLLDYFLFCDNAFRIAPPLIINDDEIDYAIEIIHKTLDQI